MLKGRFWLLASAMALCACAPSPKVPSGTQVLDEAIALVRNTDPQIDTATRELTVEDDSILVAIVDENLTDVRLRISAVGGEPVVPVEVENNLSGAGVELATLAAPEGARVTFTLTSAQDAKQPGVVHLRVRQFAASAARDAQFGQQLDAYRSWTAATDAALRAAAAHKTGAADMQRAIDAFAGVPAEAALAAHARLIKARLLYFFKIDWRESRAEAQRAAAAFAALPQPDALNGSRARTVEALALIELSNDRESKDPTADEAKQLARTALDALSADTSPLGAIERARVLTALGRLDIAMSRADDALQRFEAARAIHVAQGNVAGEREMRFYLGMLLVEQGKFTDAARAFEELLPDMDRLTDPAMRVEAYLNAARGLSFSGRPDQGAELMLKALPLARDYQLRDQEATALQGLGYIYQNRGDHAQATSFLLEALNIAREGKDVAGYVTALASAGAAARNSGDLARAFELHQEAVRKAPTPVLQVRSRFDLGIDYYAGEDLPAAIAQYREALSVNLNDPASHIYTDGKLGLAIFLAEYQGSTPKDLDEADRLVAEGLRTSYQVRDDWRVIFAHRALGYVQMRRGKLGQARATFEKTLTLARAYREHSSSSTEARSSMLRDESRAFQGYLDIVLADVAKRGPGVLRPASAAELAGMRRLELARQGSFGALRVGTLDAKTHAHLDGLLEQMAKKGLRIAALVRAEVDATQQAELQQLQIDMAQLHAELDHVRAAAAAKNSLGATRTETYQWRSLAPGTVQVSYVLADKRVYAMVRSAAGTQLTVLAPARKDLEKELTALATLDSRGAPQEFEAALAQVSAQLMPAGLLPAKTSAVEIVAEGRIANVPFSALRSPTDAQRRLVETHDIAMITSLFVGDEAPRLRHLRPFRFVALASGSGTYRAAASVDPAPRLQAATREIKVAADLFSARDPHAKVKLFTGADGTANALRDIWASGADVVHFATHALADLRQPVASLLVLPATDSAGKSTYLTAGQVQAWRGDTELVFLSACESAVGPPQFAAGMPGLQLAFLRAGARGVIATLAPIEDVLAQQFSEDFYARYTGGQSAARALSETQRAWLTPKPGANEADMMRRRLTALSHAYYSN